MKSLEIITVRSSRDIPEDLVAEILRYARKTNRAGKPEGIHLYHHAGVEGDLCIHIHWNSKANAPSKSSFGLTLCSELKKFGLLNHSVWLESRDRCWDKTCERPA